MSLYFRFSILIFSIGLLVSSCFEWVEDIKVNIDFSGTYKTTINMSSSKVRLSSFLAMDSIKGRKVPSEQEIEKELNEFVVALNQHPAIQNAACEHNFDDYIFRFSFDFDHVDHIYPAISAALEKVLDTAFVEPSQLPSWLVNKYEIERKFPKITAKTLKKWQQHEDVEDLKNAKYTMIMRLPYSIKKTMPSNSRISKNQQSMLYTVSPYSVLFTPSLLSVQAGAR